MSPHSPAVAYGQALRERVIRGANEHPGAVAIENEAGVVVRLDKLSRPRREAVARLLLTPSGARSTTAASGASAASGEGPFCMCDSPAVQPAVLSGWLVWGEGQEQQQHCES